MSTSASDSNAPRAERVRVTKEALVVDLVDGRTIMAPLAWYPRLLHGSPQERSNWRLIGCGDGIHWPDLDEDVGIDGLLAGRPSGESQTSFKTWLDARTGRRPNKRVQPTASRRRRG